MTIFHLMQKKLAEEFSNLCEAFYIAQEWLEEGDFVSDVRSGFDTLTGKGDVRFEKYEPRAALKH